MLDYKLLEAAAMVVMEGGFDKAARKLNLTQSAVSQRIKLLEEQTGQILLVRSLPPKATPAGRRMLKHYLQVKRLEDDLSGSLAPAPVEGFASLSMGVNEDSLATWFLDAISPFLKQESVVLDLRVDDQEQTHRLLRDGEVVGCISSLKQSMQGCRTTYLGRMDYQLLASPAYKTRWFPKGLTSAGIRSAPSVLFNRKDDLHNKVCEELLGEPFPNINTFYLPSSEKFVEIIASGLACGMVPDLQGAPLIAEGTLVELAPEYSIPVELYWHCWNLKSNLLEKLTRILTEQARSILKN